MNHGDQNIASTSVHDNINQGNPSEFLIGHKVEPNVIKDINPFPRAHGLSALLYRSIQEGKGCQRSQVGQSMTTENYKKFNRWTGSCKCSWNTRSSF